MQENRSFDSYFGTYPGADGIPGLAGHPGPLPCIPDPLRHGACTRTTIAHDVNFGGPHEQGAYNTDYDSGQHGRLHRSRQTCHNALDPRTASPTLPVDMMGYHDQREIPNYWTYAHNFVLQDHMFEPNASWSLPAHLFLVSEWSAICLTPGNPFTCMSNIEEPGLPSDIGPPHPAPDYPWTDLTYLFDQPPRELGILRREGTEPDCEDAADVLHLPAPGRADSRDLEPAARASTPSARTTSSGNIRDTSRFYAAVHSGHSARGVLGDTERDRQRAPTSSIRAGQAYVTGLINAVRPQPGVEEHRHLPDLGRLGRLLRSRAPTGHRRQRLRLRVPGLVISPYARRGYIDHQQLSFDAFAKFIEDDFLGGQRLNPKTDGRPDPRPDVRENAPGLGNLARDFNFNQKPRRPLILPPHPRAPA